MDKKTDKVRFSIIHCADFDAYKDEHVTLTSSEDQINRENRIVWPLNCYCVLVQHPVLGNVLFDTGIDSRWKTRWPRNLAEGYPVELSLPQSPMPEILADESLLRRAVGNLLANCVRHNAPGCLILVGGMTRGAWCVLFVESGAPAGPVSPPGEQPADGSAAHGTGLKLVSQIASAHGGFARFVAGAHFRCEIRLPVTRR